MLIEPGALRISPIHFRAPRMEHALAEGPDKYLGWGVLLWPHAGSASDTRLLLSFPQAYKPKMSGFVRHVHAGLPICMARERREDTPDLGRCCAQRPFFVRHPTKEAAPTSSDVSTSF
jgi:hypothetical protein